MMINPGTPLAPAPTPSLGRSIAESVPLLIPPLGRIGDSAPAGSRTASLPGGGISGESE